MARRTHVGPDHDRRRAVITARELAALSIAAFVLASLLLVFAGALTT
jgi:hypothetical protein